MEGPSCKIMDQSEEQKEQTAPIVRKAWHSSSPVPVLLTTGRLRGQARRGGAPPQLPRATTTPPRHHNSTAPPQLHRATATPPRQLLHLHCSPSAHRQGRQLLTNCSSSPEVVLPQPPCVAALPYLSLSRTLLLLHLYLPLSSYPASPASRSCAKLLLLQFSV